MSCAHPWLPSVWSDLWIYPFVWVSTAVLLQFQLAFSWWLMLDIFMGHIIHFPFIYPLKTVSFTVCVKIFFYHYLVSFFLTICRCLCFWEVSCYGQIICMFSSHCVRWLFPLFNVFKLIVFSLMTGAFAFNWNTSAYGPEELPCFTWTTFCLFL